MTLSDPAPTNAALLDGYAKNLDTEELMMLYKEIEKTECPEGFQKKDLLEWFRKQPVSEDLRRQVGEIQALYDNLSLARRETVLKNKAAESSSSPDAASRKIVDWENWPGSVDVAGPG
jgi:hypothetical protein